MARKEYSVYECDKCGSAEGERYIITFPDGKVRTMDRCSKHNRTLERLREEPGEWVKKPTRETYRVTPLGQIRAQMQK